MNWLEKSNMLVPVDLSPACLYAVEAALKIVNEPSQVHVLHVQIPMDIAAPAIPWGASAAAAAGVDELKQAQESLNNFMQQVSQAGLQTAVRSGRPGPTIAAYAEENGIELIVMPSHGHSGLQRFLLGSVTERVLRTASCPVLVLRHETTDEDEQPENTTEESPSA